MADGLSRIILRECRLCKSPFDGRTPYGRHGICPKCMMKLRGLYDSVHNYLRDHDLTTFSSKLIADEIKADPEEIDALLELGLLERDIQTYVGIKSKRQELAGKFQNELGRMIDRKKTRSYGGTIYIRDL